MKNTLASLANSLDFTNEQESAEYIFNTFLNGQYTASRKMFGRLRKDEQRKCIIILRDSADDNKLLRAIISWLNR